MAMTCSVCLHDERMTIDRLLGTGKVSLRDLAEQFSLSTTAMHRHKDHVVASVKRTIERRTVEREAKTTSVWTERLEGAYGLAESGARFLAEDSKGAGARFLAVMAKLIETGLEVDGVIGPNAIASTVTTCEQVLILPQHSSLSASIETTCELDTDPTLAIDE